MHGAARHCLVYRCPGSTSDPLCMGQLDTAWFCQCSINSPSFRLSAFAKFESSAQSDDSTEYLKKTINPTLLKGLTELCKEKPEDPLVSHILQQRVYFHHHHALLQVWLAEWLLRNNPNKPRVELPSCC